MRTCGQCRYFEHVGGGLGKCHLYPPKIVKDRESGYMDSYWPDVPTDGFCGQFKDTPAHEVLEAKGLHGKEMR